MNIISLSRTVFEIFDFNVFRVWRWPLISEGYLGSKNFIPLESSYMTSYLTSMDIISLSRTVSELFDFNSFKVWLDLWPPKVIRGRNVLYHSNADIWLLIWLLWTPSLYLVKFSRYSTSKFLRFDFDIWPLKVITHQIFYTIRKPIYDFLFNLYWDHFSISYRSRDNTGQNFEGRTKWRILTFWRSRKRFDFFLS